MDLLGLWVEGPVRCSSRFCEPKVVSPVPYCPPGRGIPENYRRFRRVERAVVRNGIEVFHPRFVVGPGYSLYNFEWMFYYAGIRKLVDRLRETFQFDLIHAHFTYPDGAAATLLGRRYDVPVVITEHIPWEAWVRFPRVLRRAGWAARQAARHISVSESVRKSVKSCIGQSGNLMVVPNGVDGEVFTPAAQEVGKVSTQILFAGAVRRVKGVDVLLKALRLLADSGRSVNLVIAGEPFYAGYRKEQERLEGMVRDLRLLDRVRFVGKKSPTELARYMQQSALLVLPSQLESFGMVLVEALACGTPVVSTRSGGPEDIVNSQVGVLVPPGDPEALSRGIADVLDRVELYDPAKLRAHALSHFGLESVSDRMAEIYRDVVRGHGQRRNMAEAQFAGDRVAG